VSKVVPISMMQKGCPFSDLGHAHWLRLASRRCCGKTTIPAGGGSLAIRINVVQSRCNRSVERSRYAESLSDEREQ
jgi:hypothetical protein